MDISLEYYRIFYYTAEMKNITAAADELCISQPAVSQAIKLLEQYLNTKLFVRNSKGVILTTEGRELYGHVKQGYEKIMNGESIIKKMNSLQLGEIKIGASDMTLRYYLLNYLEKFHDNYPDIKLTVTNGPTPETLSYLREGKIDFGVVSSPFEEDSGIEKIEVRKIRDVFIAGSRFIKLKGRKVHYNELEMLPIICLEQNTSTRQYIDDYLKKYGVMIKPEIELATSDIIVQFAIKNLGVGLVVEDFAKEFIDSGHVFKIEFEEPILDRSFCIVKNIKNPVSKAASKLLSQLTPE